MTDYDDELSRLRADAAEIIAGIERLGDGMQTVKFETYERLLVAARLIEKRIRTIEATLHRGPTP